MQYKLAVDDSDMEPSVAWAHDNFLSFSFAANCVLRYPWANEVRTEFWEFLNLFNNIFELVVGSSFGSGEVVECSTV